jgi:Putative rhamnosyl transferase
MVSDPVSLYVLTRFNVRFAGVGSPKRLEPGWLQQRFELFESICLPAVQAQTRQPDRWLVFLDIQTPEAFQQRMAALVSAYPKLLPVYCDTFSVPLAAQQVAALLPAGADWVLTARLDSDDAIHHELLAVLSAAAPPGVMRFVNPTQGLVIHGDRFYRKRDHSSPFIAFSEPAQGLRTVWFEQHHLVARHAPVLQLPLRDAWLQLVHGGNVANQVRGVRADPRSIDGGTMPTALSSRLRPAHRLDLLLDNSVGLLNRYVRSAWRRARTEWRTRMAR